MAELATAAAYPVRLEFDYPERQSRWKALLRLPLSLPLIFFGVALQSAIIVAVWMAILVSGRIPYWLFDFQVALNRWTARAGAYFLLLTDEYPPFEGEHPVRYDVQYPERLSRWKLVIWKFITSIAHGIVLGFLYLGLLVAVVVGWFAILITGRFPSGLHGYVGGVARWGSRLSAYATSLTDEFPPFSLSSDAGAGGRQTYLASASVGVLFVGAAIGLAITVLVVLAVGSQRIVTEVSYERLVAGRALPEEGRVEVHSGIVYLRAAVDPADEEYAFLSVRPGHRLVEFRFSIRNWRGAGEEVPISTGRFELEDTNGDTYSPVLATVDRQRIAPTDIKSGDTAALQLLFELPDGADPAKLEYDVLEYLDWPPFGEKIIYEFGP